ncbi:hypothetical protein ACLOJK_023386 [Asimina triloba]
MTPFNSSGHSQPINEPPLAGTIEQHLMAHLGSGYIFDPHGNPSHQSSISGDQPNQRSRSSGPPITDSTIRSTPPPAATDPTFHGAQSTGSVPAALFGHHQAGRDPLQQDRMASTACAMASDPPLSLIQMQRVASRFKSTDVVWANPNHSKDRWPTWGMNNRDLPRQESCTQSSKASPFVNGRHEAGNTPSSAGYMAAWEATRAKPCCGRNKQGVTQPDRVT